ncbi:zinc finger and SCAN domain-containing protein 32-like [Dermochelys coriacea]|uniref:zinc finger and SCAN domain-containing protein 32-like n=1 Tax=Dermochelys coriacea TaxID=27794 RepID=UPI001CA9C295|nr:zinc finger and SCAN domain-containing protein 32-like [Dermochelys coriacea]
MDFDTYGQISRGMLEKGYEQDTQQGHVKIKELRPVYQKARESNYRSGAVPKTCCFYKELDAILGGNPAPTAKSPVDTLVGLEMAESGLNPEDKVVDEEVELEDDVEHIAGSSGGMASQDLSSALEGSSQSQQPVSGVHDAGEESYDVAFRGTPYTPAEHLRHIRK